MTIDEFQKCELKVGTVLSADRVPNSEKLLKLQIDLGEKNAEGAVMPRQVLAGIGKVYAPEALVGAQLVVIANLEPRMLMGEESRGMVLATHGVANEPIILIPQKPGALPGSSIS